MALPYQERDLRGGLDAFEPEAGALGLRRDAAPGCRSHREVRAAVASRRAALAGRGRAASSRWRRSSPQEMLDGVCRFFEARSLQRSDAACRSEARPSVLPFIAEWCTWRAAGFSGRDVMQAYAPGHDDARGGGRGDRAASTSSCRPTSPILAYEAELAAPGNDPRNALHHIAFTVPYNMSEQPAASINCVATAPKACRSACRSSARRFDDLGVLRMARAYETLRPPLKPWPEPS